jgi:hypothetical protein
MFVGCNGYKPYIDSVIDAAAVLRGEKSIEEITYKEPKDNKVWGTRRPRPSLDAKVTGTWISVRMWQQKCLRIPFIVPWFSHRYLTRILSLLTHPKLRKRKAFSKL